MNFQASTFTTGSGSSSFSGGSRATAGGDGSSKDGSGLGLAPSFVMPEDVRAIQAFTLADWNGRQTSMIHRCLLANSVLLSLSPSLSNNYIILHDFIMILHAKDANVEYYLPARRTTKTIRIHGQMMKIWSNTVCVVAEQVWYKSLGSPWNFAILHLFSSW